MNTPANDIKVVEAWLGSNWYAYGLGCVSGIGLAVVAHLLKLV